MNRKHPDSGRITTSSDVIADLHAEIERLERELSHALQAADVEAREADRLRSIATPQSGWLPIESAPRDGTPIILCYVSGNDDYGWFVAQGRWHEEDHDGPDNMGHDAGFMDDRFAFFRCARSFGNPAYQSEGLQPTHWQPLPPPPITKGESNV